LFSQSSADTNKIEKSNGFKLVGGVGLGLASGSFNYFSFSNKSGSESSEIAGSSSDILNEYKLFVNSKFSESFGVGLEFGRLTYFKLAGSSSNGFGMGNSEINQYISGLYFSPYLLVGNFQLGFSYMSPTPSTYFVRVDDDITSDYNYEDLSPNDQKVFDEILQAYLNVYVAYNIDLRENIDLPVTGYIKLGYDIQSPFDYTKTTSVVSQDIRAFMTIGVTYSFDLVK